MQMWGAWSILWHQDCTWVHQESTLLAAKPCTREDRGLLQTVVPWGTMCIKDHYPELVIQESIMWSLKGAAADMARYMGPTASVSDIIQKLMVIFRTVASFYVPMQNFCKVTAGEPWKSALICHKTRGDFKSNPVKMPKMDSWLWGGPGTSRINFSTGVHKHIWDSIRYLYSNPETTYSQLMVTAHKAESETEEAKNKVRVRSAVTTKGGGWLKRARCNQIARLMAAPYQEPEQGNCPTNAPIIPRLRGHGRGQTNRNTPTCPSSHNGWTGLGQTTSACSSSAANQDQVPCFSRKGNTQGSNGGQGTKDSNSFQCFWCQGWGHMARECTTPAKMLNKDGGTWGSVAKPPTSSSQQ